MIDHPIPAYSMAHASPPCDRHDSFSTHSAAAAGTFARSGSHMAAEHSNFPLKPLGSSGEDHSNGIPERQRSSLGDQGQPSGLNRRRQQPGAVFSKLASEGGDGAAEDWVGRDGYGPTEGLDRRGSEGWGAGGSAEGDSPGRLMVSEGSPGSDDVDPGGAEQSLDSVGAAAAVASGGEGAGKASQQPQTFDWRRFLQGPAGDSVVLAHVMAWAHWPPSLRGHLAAASPINLMLLTSSRNTAIGNRPVLFEEHLVPAVWHAILNLFFEAWRTHYSTNPQAPLPAPPPLPAARPSDVRMPALGGGDGQRPFNIQWHTSSSLFGSQPPAAPLHDTPALTELLRREGVDYSSSSLQKAAEALLEAFRYKAYKRYFDTGYHQRNRVKLPSTASGLQARHFGAETAAQLLATVLVNSALVNSAFAAKAFQFFSGSASSNLQRRDIHLSHCVAWTAFPCDAASLVASYFATNIVVLPAHANKGSRLNAHADLPAALALHNLGLLEAVWSKFLEPHAWHHHVGQYMSDPNARGSEAGGEDG